MILLLECGIIQARSGSGQKFAGASHQNCGCAHCLVRWLSSLSGLIPTICREGVETETISRSHSPHGECGFQLNNRLRTLGTVKVTLRTGSVDFNVKKTKTVPVTTVTLRTGSVDFNARFTILDDTIIASLSARGVWISTHILEEGNLPGRSLSARGVRI